MSKSGGSVLCQLSDLPENIDKEKTGPGRTSDKDYYANIRLCILCGHPFYFSDKRKKYCSARCRKLAWSNSEKGLSARKNYYQKNADRIKAHTKNYYYNNLHQSSAKNAIGWRIHFGYWERAKSCELCGSSKYITAHHPDYSKPLLIQWLCKSCHRKLHAQIRAEVRG